MWRIASGLHLRAYPRLAPYLGWCFAGICDSYKCERVSHCMCVCSDKYSRKVLWAADVWVSVPPSCSVAKYAGQQECIMVDVSVVPACCTWL